ncbi:conserved membrane hypothetical protein [Bosea sp. 62]|uniref:hypothetical protein n=1 Tax=unclassified Bosea (in: a-proteobacteria) TaxID=2653178 RepID=UPI001259AE3B|nr:MULTISPECIES: hypothetical protein [unclassified Bosea (in: a-proteobacteria)]CAD5249573.1 conserved membrane hypothetical protein [Bosea sp. 7B]CAD5282984.1 conserved membrane hypothetical protein [Bosea sp. 21B]CAD5285647.1 conserved membrane hypothetical protein [Bosea sp. 46]VVT62309.1 conserved membrane hypothetical protein [Bosea sp. EC-HK365B]VXB19574.1 conserved membrane hypothetical protein [Bosea sp. 62]
MLRWLLLIPFALLFAIGSGLVALMIAGVASPDLGLLIGGGFDRLLSALFDQAERGFDPGPTAEAAFALLGRLGFAILVLPVVLVAIGSELFRFRSGLIQSGLTGLLAAILPLAMLGMTRTPSAGEMQVVSALFLVGAATGFVYWLIAGRGAGGEKANRPDLPRRG